MNRRATGVHCCIMLALALLLMVSGWAQADEGGKYAKELAEEWAALEADGFVHNIGELVPTDVPLLENAAPLYMQVLNIHWDEVPDMEGAGYYRGIGGLNEWEEEALAQYVAGEWEGEVVATVREVFARTQMQAAIDSLRIASAMPHAVFPVDWESGPAVTLPHLAKFRAGARLLCTYAALLAEEGETHKALDICAVCLRMSRHAASEPCLISQLVAIAMQDLALERMQQIAFDQPVSVSAASDLIKLLGQMDLQAAYKRAMIGETAFGWSVFQQVRNEPSAVLQVLGGDLDQQQRDALVARYSTPEGQDLLDLDELRYLRAMRQWVEACALPSREAAKAWEDIEPQIQGGGIFTRVLMPALGKMVQKRDAARAHLDIARIALALKAHKAAHGKYPETLDDLQKSLDWQLPQDVLTGWEFAYNRADEGFILHSQNDAADARGVRSAEWRASE